MALMLPLLFLITAFGISFSLTMRERSLMVQAAREGARMAAHIDILQSEPGVWSAEAVARGTSGALTSLLQAGLSADDYQIEVLGNSQVGQDSGRNLPSIEVRVARNSSLPFGLLRNCVRSKFSLRGLEAIEPFREGGPVECD